MNFKPILFSTPMVRAILEERKTMTRRIVHMTKEAIEDANWGWSCFTPPGSISFRAKHADGQFGESFIKMPYQKGDILWVREEHYAYGEWMPNGFTAAGRKKWKFKVADEAGHCFKMEQAACRPNSYRKSAWYKRLGRFMPKKYARIFLEITEVRVERLQDISEADAIAEGVELLLPGNSMGYRSYAVSNGGGGVFPYVSFKTLWQKINGPESWEANPWVWCISFKRIERPENFLTPQQYKL